LKENERATERLREMKQRTTSREALANVIGSVLRDTVARCGSTKGSHCPLIEAMCRGG
jgi:hypothetical protein